MSSESSADVPTTPWSPPDPVQVPDLRAALATQMQTSFEVSRTAQALVDGRGSIVPPSRDPEEAARILCGQEHARLVDAALYAVTAEMTRLAVVAGESLPDFHLEPEDVPSHAGFMVFDEPIGSYMNSDGLAPERFLIVAVRGRGRVRDNTWDESGAAGVVDLGCAEESWPPRRAWDGEAPGASRA